MGDISEKNWHVLTKTENGTVSILRNMSLMEAVDVSARLDPWYGMQLKPGFTTSRMVQPSDLVLNQIIGPDGWDGCKKAFFHDYQDKKTTLCDAGPNKGRSYETGRCSHCGHGRWEWINASARAS